LKKIKIKKIKKNKKNISFLFNAPKMVVFFVKWSFWSQCFFLPLNFFPSIINGYEHYYLFITLANGKEWLKMLNNPHS